MTPNPLDPTGTPSPAKPDYVPPRIRTYTTEEILEQVGPALTCSTLHCEID